MAGPLQYHRRYHSDILNAYVGMPLELRGAYDTILELLYERMRPLPNDPKWLSRWLECSSRKTQSLIDELVSRGKIYLTVEGSISNKRFEIEAKDREEWSKTSSTSAAKRWRKYRETDTEPNKNNDVGVKPQSQGNAIQLNSNYNYNSREGEHPSAAPSTPTTNGHKIRLKKKAATPMPEGWEPSRDDLQVGLDLGFNQQKITDEWEKFKDHSDATGRVLVNWGSGFRMWLRKAAEYGQSKTQRV